jgi:hypothetical protein
MLVVVAVIVTLMAILFRLSGLGEDAERRTYTIVRMQRLENCLSGYYAAFGSYPPVKLHGSRDIYRDVDGNGIQSTQASGSRRLDWNRVRAACASQPVGCRFPFPAGYKDLVDGVSAEMARRAEMPDEYPAYQARAEVFRARFDDGYTDNPNRHSRNKGLVDWSNVQLFKFGVMSFLLPRYLVMLRCGDVFTDYAQWTANNVLPCDPFNGGAFTSWQQLKNLAAGNASERARVANIPSQSVCARWMPNLEGICVGNSECELFGVKILEPSTGDLFPDNVDIEVFSPDGFDRTSNQYVLDGYTVCDGWGHPFYYYSPAPYQAYTLWSGGPNGFTFPPWVSRSELGSSDNATVGTWVADDIVHLSN